MSRSRVSPWSIPRIPTRGLSRVRRTFPAARDVVELQAPGHTRHDAQPPRERHRVEGAVRAGLRGREPDLPPRGGPGESVLARPLAGELRLLSRQVDDGDRARVVERKCVIEKGDPVAARRQPRVADVARGLVEDLAHRELDAGLPADVAHDEHRRSVRGPVDFLDSLRHVPGRPAGQRGARQSPRADARVVRRHRPRWPSLPRARSRAGWRWGEPGAASRGWTGV